MANVTARCTPNVNLTQTPSSGFLSGVTSTIPATLGVTLNNGSGADTVSLMACTTLSLAGSAQTIDLTNMTDVFGNAVNFAKVRYVIIRNNATTDGYTVAVGNAASNQFSGFISATGTLTVYPGTTANPQGGFAILSAPGTTPAAVDGTHKSLKFDPGANTFTVDVFLCGA